MFSSAPPKRSETKTHRGLSSWLSKNNLRYFLSTKGFSFEVSLAEPHGSARDAPRDEVIGIDFWHAVEFSRFGRAPSSGPADQASGQPFKFTRLLHGRQIRDPLIERPDPSALGSRREDLLYQASGPAPTTPGAIPAGVRTATRAAVRDGTTRGRVSGTERSPPAEPACFGRRARRPPRGVRSSLTG
jgi:hypothetical protein